LDIPCNNAFIQVHTAIGIIHCEDEADTSQFGRPLTSSYRLFKGTPGRSIGTIRQASRARIDRAFGILAVPLDVFSSNPLRALFQAFRCMLGNQI
jgi:hypothetical protein